MVNGIIIGFIVGLLGGMILMAGVMLKDFDKAWDEAYELGFKHGEEVEKIRQVNGRKEKMSFELPEVNKND
jgi:hypothetical protein